MAEDKGLAFVIDGREYPSPDLDSLNMLERRVMYDLCGIIQEDFAPQDGETAEQHDERLTQMMRHPGFMESLMHIAYQRGNPDVKRQQVSEVIEATNYLDAIQSWADAEVDTSPLALTSSPDVPSLSGKGSSSESSGEGSKSDSDEQVVTLPPTGTLRWGTSPMSALETSSS